MNPKIIKTDKEHETALIHIESLMDAGPGSPEEDKLELWAMLVEQYEEEHFPMSKCDPVEEIKFRMDQMGLQQKDLLESTPTKSKISEVLNRKRSEAITRNS